MGLHHWFRRLNAFAFLSSRRCGDGVSIVTIQEGPSWVSIGLGACTIKKKIDRVVHVRVVSLVLNRNKPPAE